LDTRACGFAWRSRRWPCRPRAASVSQRRASLCRPFACRLGCRSTAMIG
jgi:hypothetical protein